MHERKKDFLKYTLLFIVFLIAVILAIIFLVTAEFNNWVEYQISIVVMVTLIFFMGFFFFSAFHYIIRK
jgi:predicted Na+-dependent transporter